VAASSLATLADVLSSEAFVEKRTRRRRRVLLAGKIAFGMAAADCTIRDITEMGARVHASSIVGLPEEVFLLIMREGLVVRARRVWSRPPLFGLKFIEAEGVESSRNPQSAALRQIWQEWVDQQRSG
jgi:hypothetical protein